MKFCISSGNGFLHFDGCGYNYSWPNGDGYGCGDGHRRGCGSSYDRRGSGKSYGYGHSYDHIQYVHSLILRSP